MTIDAHHRPLYHAFIEQGLDTWLALLPEQLARGLDRKRFGDIPAWERAVARLPAPGATRAALDRDSVSVDLAFSPADRARTESLLKILSPWRKGPYRIGDIEIDTEWRSDWKWQRLAPHLGDLTHRRVLDVGGGNGYHGWRMAGNGAAFVLIVDPSPRFYWQYQAIHHFIRQADEKTSERVHFLPVGIEDVPARLEAFDTVFSMGVLYHRRSPLDHLSALFEALRPGGELVLETLVVEGDAHRVLMPGDRYAKMPNVWFLPSSLALLHWLSRLGFIEARVVDEADTTTDEQRATEWMTFQSLSDFLHPDDPSLTLEGYPAPRRAVIIARRP